jgi:putative ABC transport system permease protein
VFGMTLRSIAGNRRFYLPYVSVVLVAAFLFTTVLSLAVYSSLIYKKSGSGELLAVFEGNRACPLASLVPETYKSRIEGVPHVEDVTGEVRHMIVYAPKRSLTVAGVEPEKFRNFKDIKIKDSEYQGFAGDQYGVIIGRKVQRTFGWKVGQSITFQGLSFNVRGVFTLPMSVYNGMIIFHKEYMQELVKKKGYSTAFTLKIDSPENISAVSSAVEALFAGHPTGIVCRSETEFWGRTEKQLGDFGRNMRGLVGVCALLILGLTANGAVLTLKSRQGQVRILKTAGFGRRRICGLLWAETVTAVVMSAAGGSLLAFLVWIKKPTIGGSQAILPPIAVTPQVVVMSIVVIVAIAAIPAVIAAVRFSGYRG